MITINIFAHRGEGAYTALRNSVNGIAYSPQTFCCLVLDDYQDLKGHKTLETIPGTTVHYIDITPAIRLTSEDSIDDIELSNILKQYCQKGNIVAFHLYHPIAKSILFAHIEKCLDTTFEVDANNQIYLFSKDVTDKTTSQQTQSGYRQPLPCKVGDTLYRIDIDPQLNSNAIEELCVDNIVICANGEILLKYDSYDGVICTAQNLIEKATYLDYYVTFTSRKEAEQYLEEKKGLKQNDKACKRG